MIMGNRFDKVDIKDNGQNWQSLLMAMRQPLQGKSQIPSGDTGSNVVNMLTNTN